MKLHSLITNNHLSIKETRVLVGKNGKQIKHIHQKKKIITLIYIENSKGNKSHDTLLKTNKKMATNLKDELKDQIDGQTDEHKEIVIEKETQKFMEIFNRVFSEGENENSIEDIEEEVDGIVEDILNTIVNRVKTILKHQFIRKLLEEEEEDGKNEISSEKET